MPAHPLYPLQNPAFVTRVTALPWRESVWCECERLHSEMSLHFLVKLPATQTSRSYRRAKTSRHFLPCVKAAFVPTCTCFLAKHSSETWEVRRTWSILNGLIPRHSFKETMVGFLRFWFLFAESQLFCEARIPGTDKRISDSIVKWNRLEPKAL